MQNCIGRELRWYRSRLLMPTKSELRAGDDVVATVVTKGWLRRAADITTAEDRWTVRPPGLVTRTFLIERTADGSQVAEYHGRIRQGDLRFTNGESYTLSGRGLLPLSIRVENQHGSVLLTIRLGWPSIRRTGRVEIDSAGSAEPQLGLLAAFAFHVLAVRRRRAARRS
jgi:hypothetical protein